MDRTYQANTSGTAPTLAAGSETGYPTAGSKATGQQATVPGPYWFHMVTEELRNAIVGMGLTPSASSLNQLATALGKLLPTSGGTMTGPIKFDGSYDIYTANSTNQISIHNTSSASGGAGIWLYGNDNQGEGKARIQVYDPDNSRYRAFDVRRDGTVGFDGKDVAVIETWRNGDEWYRKYVDGWVEQGGAMTPNTSGWVLQNLHVPMIDTNYQAMATNHGENSDAYTVKVGTNKQNTTTAVYLMVKNVGSGIRWEVKGKYK